MKKIVTADNSETYVDEELGEAYHSHTGAVEEALRKYAIPCKIKEKAKTGKIRILDMFFGMGYNSAMAIDVALEENPDCVIEVVGLEKDSKIIEKIQEVNPLIKSFSYYRELTLDNLEVDKGNVKVKILLGCAKETIKQLKEEDFDAIFFDPFSPKTQPKMWSEDIFKEVYRVMKPTANFATYSCARLGRENMAKAGLFYDDGPMVGRRGPGTVATKWVF